MVLLFWSKEEDEILKEFYSNPNVSHEDLVKMLPQRTWSAIVTHAKVLDLKRGRSGTVDIEYVKKVRTLLHG